MWDAAKPLIVALQNMFGKDCVPLASACQGVLEYLLNPNKTPPSLPVGLVSWVWGQPGRERGQLKIAELCQNTSCYPDVICAVRYSVLWE
jgi:hypothetical protein